MPANFALDYIDVAERIATFREKHPEGSLQQVSLDFREVGNGWWAIYTAAAYRTPDDQRPGIGTAWEPIPGRTNFTRDSEVQNAETAAWGRAIVAALAGDTKRSIASAEEVRNRQADPIKPDPVDSSRITREKGDPLDALKAEVLHAAAPPAFGSRDEFEAAFLDLTGTTYAAADKKALQNFLASLEMQVVT